MGEGFNIASIISLLSVEDESYNDFARLQFSFLTFSFRVQESIKVCLTIDGDNHPTASFFKTIGHNKWYNDLNREDFCHRLLRAKPIE